VLTLLRFDALPRNSELKRHNAVLLGEFNNHDALAIPIVLLGPSISLNFQTRRQHLQQYPELMFNISLSTGSMTNFDKSENELSVKRI
jgi:hypothetical protein